MLGSERVADLVEEDAFDVLLVPAAPHVDLVSADSVDPGQSAADVGVLSSRFLNLDVAENVTPDLDVHCLPAGQRQRPLRDGSLRLG